MRFSCSLPIADSDANPLLNIDGITRIVRAVDRAHLDAVFVTDHPAPSQRWLDNGGHPTLDPFVALAIAATASERVRLHTHILVLAYRNPLIVAKSVASLDRLSNGRFTMGIGTGYLKSEYAAVGAPYEERGALTDEAITVLRKAWTGQPINHSGTRFSARDVCVRPTPAQTTLPIWAGGNSKRAIRRAVELCQGWSPFPVKGVVTSTTKTDELSNMEQLREKIDYAREYAATAGRTEPLDICMSAFGRSTWSLCDPGDSNRLVDEYSALAAAGVSWSTVSLPSPSLSAFEENTQWFAEEIASKVNS